MSDNVELENLFKRRLLVMFIVFMVICFLLVLRLVWIQVIKADELYNQAWSQWNRSIPALSDRGSIYDRNGRLLAGSTSVETVVAVPPHIKDVDKTVSLLAPLLEESPSRIKELMTRPRSGVYIKRKVSKEVADKVRELELPGITFTVEGQRYYPQGKLAAQIIGVVGMDNGLSGLELIYENRLRGREGKMYFPSDARDRPIPHEVRRFVLPKGGEDLYLTIDDTIQYILERELSRAMEEFVPRQALALAVNPMTGEILAAASKPDYDPQHFSAYAPELWKLSPITSTFEPGSTLKLATLMAMVEEGLFDPEEKFFCTGSLEVAGNHIGCWTSGRGGHGSISFYESVLGSCNPAFMVMGQRLGAERLFGYLRNFGFGTKSGVDYPGEGSGIIFQPSQVGPLELATTSFGQGVSVTPLQQVMAYSAIANGGYLMQPYIVSEIRDANGKTIHENGPRIIRQIISNESSRFISEIMEKVVTDGSGINAYIEGHRVAGKTGTAQKVGEDGRYKPGDFILSFVGFVPVDNPQIMLYVAVDGATKGSQWGSQISAPIFNRIMKDVLNYLGTKPREDTILPEGGIMDVPDLTGLTLVEAGQALDDKALLIKAIGEGDVIERQTPKPGSQVTLHSRVIVYTGGQQLPTGEVSVPDLRGSSYHEVGEILSWMGLKQKAEGSGYAVEQYPRQGTIVNRGAEVSVIYRLPVAGE